MFSSSCPYIFRLRKSLLFRKGTKSATRRYGELLLAVSYQPNFGAWRIMQKKIPFGIYLSILLGILRKSLLFRKEAKPTKSKRRPLAVFLQKSCFADMVRRNFVRFAYFVRLPMQKKIPFGILFLHIYIAVTPLAHKCKKKSLSGFCFCIWCAVRDSNPGPTD